MLDLFGPCFLLFSLDTKRSPTLLPMSLPFSDSYAPLLCTCHFFGKPSFTSLIRLLSFLLGSTAHLLFSICHSGKFSFYIFYHFTNSSSSLGSVNMRTRMASGFCLEPIRTWFSKFLSKYLLGQGMKVKKIMKKED
jgi:hypothetical protein